MCLAITDKIKDRKVATKDIICYIVANKSDNMLITYFNDTKITIKMKSAITFEYKQISEKLSSLSVQKGLHSFTTKKGAINFVNQEHALILKCIIPKGAVYYKGDFHWYTGFLEIFCEEDKNSPAKSYASNKRIIHPDSLKKYKQYFK